MLHLEGGHRGHIRDFCLIDTSSGRKLVVNGEDVWLCEWDLSGNTDTSEDPVSKPLSSKQRIKRVLFVRMIDRANETSPVTVR